MHCCKLLQLLLEVGPPVVPISGSRPFNGLSATGRSAHGCESFTRRPLFMKRSIIVLTVIVLLSLSCIAFAAEDGAAIYKSKCAACHGADGAGKVGPAVKGSALTEAQMADLLTKGAA